MTSEEIHDIVGCVLSANPWQDSKILLIKRKSFSDGEKYWPEQWCYLTEHRKNKESDKKTIVRCMDEELGLSSQPLFIKGPVEVMSIDPIYNKKFKIKLYQCVPTKLDKKMEINPTLNMDEATRWIWASTVFPFCNDSAILNDKMFEDLEDHLKLLNNSGMMYERF